MFAYDRLIEVLDQNEADYRVIDHAPEGRTELVSRLRSHPPREAAKCIILLVKGDKKSQFVLAVVPGDARVDFDAVRRVKQGRSARFAEQRIAEELSGSVAGTILPFAWNERLSLLVDPAVAESEVMYFNAGRLDRSVALRTSDYLRIAEPQIARIAANAAASG